MENSHSRRNQTIGIYPSPRLLRSKSGTPNMSAPPEIPPLTTNSIRSSIPRSKSTTRTTRINKDEENRDNNLVGILRSHRNSDSGKAVEIAKTKRTRSVSNSPSAWALSPGRSPPPSISPKLDSRGAKPKSGGMSGVLRYFRPNKVSPVQEEAFHRFRVLHTRLVQWRVVNARAETAMVTGKSVAEEKLFNVWLKIFRLQNSVVEKRIQVQKLKQEIKLLRILNPEIRLLSEWAKIEKINSEAVAKLTRNLSALSIRLPLVKGAKADMISVYKAMRMAMDVMNHIETSITEIFFQVEEEGSLLEELTKTIIQERESLEELRKTIAMVASLEVQEESLSVYLIQAAKERVVVVR